MKRRRIEVFGVVQGVGFRPFIKRLADQYGLTGSVINRGAFVDIEAQGEGEVLDRFTRDISAFAPPLSCVQTINSQDIYFIAGEKGFHISMSGETRQGVLQMPPDAGICDDCTRELRDPANRRYLYPFIACTNCGPRYSMIESAPYDRERTSMKEFPLCDDCARDYTDPHDRRYHAQPVCCQECGPRLFLLGTDGNEIPCENPIIHARGILASGGIVAAKGLGGYHLICDALNAQAVVRLRDRKRREAKPLAVMAPDIETAAKWCHINPEEQMLLQSPQRPIVLLKKRKDAMLPAAIAFDNPYLGIMLPSTAVQMLLLDYPDGQQNFDLLVMTSGNVSEEPICMNETEAADKLGTIADCILANNRPIITREDDSVMRVFHRQPFAVRRARGYAPLPVLLPSSGKATGDIIAAGGQTKNTWCLVHDNLAFVGPHIGDLDDLEALESYRQGIRRFCGQTGLSPVLGVHDLHPEYLSTRHAQTFTQHISVQHHYAHMAAALAENLTDEPAIGAIFDGTGLGTDGTIWGGEFLVGDCSEFTRIGHINTVSFFGGDRAAREPGLSASFWLRAAAAIDEAPLRLARLLEGEKHEQVAMLIRSGIGGYRTTSAGRLFDAVSAMLGLCTVNRYEGEAAMKLEWAAGETQALPYELSVDEGEGGFTVNWLKAVVRISEDILHGRSANDIAAAFHTTMAECILLGAQQARKHTGIHRIVLSGGVFQNMRLLNDAYDRLKKDGWAVILPKTIPANDGGISLGQAAVAAARLHNAGGEHVLRISG